MPELPDLQVFSKNLQKQLKGKTLEKISIAKNASVNVSEKQFKSRIEKQKVKEVYREGKQLRIRFSNNALLGLHMMLHGKLQWYEDELPKFTLVQMEFSKGTKLSLADFQQKARLELDPEPSEVPDALAAEVNVSFWKKVLQSRAKIKNLLLDQHVVRGIGNAYADEILWEAKISPFAVSENIPAAKVSVLARAVKKVLTNAEKQIAKAEPDIIGGEIRDFLKVHNAKAKTTPSGAEIKFSKAGGRKTYYTDEQEEF